MGGGGAQLDRWVHWQADRHSDATRQTNGGTHNHLDELEDTDNEVTMQTDRSTDRQQNELKNQTLMKQIFRQTSR